LRTTTGFRALRRFGTLFLFPPTLASLWPLEDHVDKRDYSERDVCTKLVTPAILRAGWGQSQFREEVKLTDGRVIVRGQLAARVKNPNAKGGPKRADYVLYAMPNIALGIVEAKRCQFGLGHGMQQALDYAEMLDAPFAISSNGDGFLIHDRTGITTPVERELLRNDPRLKRLVT
jgi:type I restriction enzyme R subunit